MAVYFLQNLSATVFFVPYLISLWCRVSSKSLTIDPLLPDLHVFTICIWTTVCSFFASTLMVARWENTIGVFLKNHDHLRPLPLIGMLRLSINYICQIMILTKINLAVAGKFLSKIPSSLKVAVTSIEIPGSIMLAFLKMKTTMGSALATIKLPPFMKLALEKFQEGLESMLTLNGLLWALKFIALALVMVFVGFPMYLAFEAEPSPSFREFREVNVSHQVYGIPEYFKVWS